MTRIGRAATRVVAAAIALAALVTGLPSGTPGVVAGSPNAVTEWSRIAQDAWSTARPGSSGMVVHALVHIAIHDAVVAIEGGSEPFFGTPPVTRPADADAAVAAAARDVLVARIDGPKEDQVEAAYAAYLAGIADGAAKTNGITVGRAAAAAVLADRVGDGLDDTVPWVQPTPGPGVFEPFPTSPPADVKIARLRPIALESRSQFRPGPPAALTSSTYARDLAEVAALGRADSTVRTAAQTAQARFWSENPFVQWNRTLRELAIARGLDRAETARFMAMTTVSFADGLVACFDAKYRYTWWRPMHAIPRADTDGNPATVADPTWTPLLVVNHPEYPTGHGCTSGAILEAIRAYFGTGNVKLTVSSTAPGAGPARTYRNLNAVRHDVFMARIYGGLHYRSTMETGFELGKHVGRYVTRHHFAALD